MSACTVSPNLDFHCPYVTGQKGALEFCPGDPNSVGKNQIDLTLGTAQEIALFPTPSSPGATYASATSDSTSVAVTPPASTNSMDLIANEVGDAMVSIVDASGNEVDRVPVHVARCAGHAGELGNAVFCGDADGNGRLAVPVSSRARITVFTPAYTRLDFTGVGSSDWSTVSPAIPTTWCDAKYDYCTNVIEITGVAKGSADIGMNAADGTELDQITIDVIDHW